MAEILTATQNKSINKLGLRVDLTPMVDLGFLLISFFIFTTQLSEARSMQLLLPPDSQHQPPPKVLANHTLLIFPDGNNTAYYSFGHQPLQMHKTNYAPSGIRAIIQQKQHELAQYGKANKLMVLIKPTVAATYGNTLAIIDEMLVNDVKRYMLTETNDAERALLNK